MSDFKYEIPDEKKFFNVLQQLLSNSSQTEAEIFDKLKGGKCTIVPTSQYSGERWNAYSTEIHFYVAINNFDFLDQTLVKKILLSLCDKIMPKDSGYDIQHIEIAPIIGDDNNEVTLTSDLEEILKSTSNKNLQFLPEDIKDKGKEMSEVYTYLYCVENSLRLFIEKNFLLKIGNQYWSEIMIPNAVKKSIKIRKDLEGKNQWIGIRGNSELFYLDFKELSNIIISNWDVFKEYFPDQHWLNVKIEELGNCRNLIAHNSYISALERDVIRLNYNQIIKQINIVDVKKTGNIQEDDLDNDLPF